MATVTVIVGLSGSGKSHEAGKLKAAGAELFNEGVRPDVPHEWQRFFAVLASGRDCAVVEIAYIGKAEREYLKREVLNRYPNTEFKWIFFENNLEVANWNCSNDPDRTPEKVRGDHANNERWTVQYEIPKDVKQRKIFRLAALKK